MVTKPLHLATSVTRKNYNSIGETFFSSNRRFDTAAYTGQRARRGRTKG